MRGSAASLQIIEAASCWIRAKSGICLDYPQPIPRGIEKANVSQESMNDTKKPDKIKVYLTACLVFLSLFSAVLSLFYMVLWRIPGRSGESEKLRLKIEQKFDRAMTVRASENGWTDYEMALSSKVRLSELKGAPDPVDEQDFIKKNMTAEQLKLARALMRANEKAFALVEQGYGKEKFQIVRDYRMDSMTKGPEFLSIRGLGFNLVIAGRVEEAEGHHREAAKRYLECLHLGAGTARNGNLLQLMIGLAIENIARAPLKELIHNELDPAVDSDILAGLKRDDRDRFTFIDALEGEFVYLENSFDIALSGNIPLGLPNTNWPKALSGALLPVVRRDRTICENWFFYSRDIYSKPYREYRKTKSSFTFPPLSVYSKIVLPDSIERGFEIYTRSRAESEGLQILAALKLYKKENGRYPDALNALVPHYLDALPKDPYAEDGRFKYMKKKGRDILLYSIGYDLVDDAGNREVSNDDPMSPGDIVFTSGKR